MSSGARVKPRLHNRARDQVPSGAQALEQPAPHTWPAWIFFLKSFKVVTDRIDRALLNSTQLSLAEFDVLQKLRAAGGRARFIELSEATMLSQSRISRQIDVLQRKGFVSRVGTQTDRRATYAVLTAEGKATFEAAAPVFVEAFDANFSGLIPPRDVLPFAEVLQMLHDGPGEESSARGT